MVIKNKRREQAAQLLAEDRHNDKKIGELCGVSLACITKWKKRPEIAARIAELTQIYADKALTEGLAQCEKRVAVLVQMHDKLLQIVDERAVDPGVTPFMKSSEQLPTKKVYQAPKLTKYGNLTEVTTAIVLGMGNKDNITGVTKTS
jgi:hypothetical protein